MAEIKNELDRYGCTWVAGQEKYSLRRSQVGVGCSIDDIWGAGQDQASWGEE